MTYVEEMSNLRGGIIYEVAMVAPTTVHSWNLNLGTTRGTGHPRYDAVDALVLVMMRQLTSEMSMAAGPAALIVNALRPMLPKAIEDAVAEQRRNGVWCGDGGPYAIVRGKPKTAHGMTTESWLTVINHDEIGPAIADHRSGRTPLLIPLRRLINTTVHRLGLIKERCPGAFLDK